MTDDLKELLDDTHFSAMVPPPLVRPLYRTTILFLRSVRLNDFPRRILNSPVAVDRQRRRHCHL
jgi:hypothetical protein